MEQVFWSASTCETNSPAKLVGDDDSILEVDSTLAPWFVFDSLASGSVVHICYKFHGAFPAVRKVVYRRRERRTYGYSS